MKKKYNTGYCRCTFDLYGTKVMVNARFSRVEAVIKEQVAGVWLEKTFFEGEHGNSVDAIKIGTLAAGVPSMVPVKLADYNLPADGIGAGGHIDMTMILPADGRTTMKWFRQAEKIMEDEGVDPFIGYHVFSNHLLFVQAYVFDKTQASHRERGCKVVSALLSAAKASGFANNRSHVRHMDTVQAMYDFNCHAYKRAVENLKAAIDPNGNTGPGKQGIWPVKKAGQFPKGKL